MSTNTDFIVNNKTITFVDSKTGITISINGSGKLIYIKYKDIEKYPTYEISDLFEIWHLVSDISLVVGSKEQDIYTFQVRIGDNTKYSIVINNAITIDVGACGEITHLYYNGADNFRKIINFEYDENYNLLSYQEKLKPQNTL